MFAVLKTGGKQYRVSVNDVLKVEKVSGLPGSEVVFDQVLLVSSQEKTVIGSPLVKGAMVRAEIVSQARDQKIIIFKKERRQHYRRKRGHRQDVTFVRVKDIQTAS